MSEETEKLKKNVEISIQIRASEWKLPNSSKQIKNWIEITI